MVSCFLFHARSLHKGTGRFLRTACLVSYGTEVRKGMPDKTSKKEKKEEERYEYSARCYSAYWAAAGRSI